MVAQLPVSGAASLVNLIILIVRGDYPHSARELGLLGYAYDEECYTGYHTPIDYTRKR
jgi:hypothetical protein